MRNFSIYSRICPHLANLEKEVSVAAVHTSIPKRSSSVVAEREPQVRARKIVENKQALAAFHGDSLKTSKDDQDASPVLYDETPYSGGWSTERYDNAFEKVVTDIKEKGNYRIFADLERQKDQFPKTIYHSPDESTREVTGWCSNDYLCMGQHPKVQQHRSTKHSIFCDSHMCRF